MVAFGAARLGDGTILRPAPWAPHTVPDDPVDNFWSRWNATDRKLLFAEVACKSCPHRVTLFAGTNEARSIAATRWAFDRLDLCQLHACAIMRA